MSGQLRWLPERRGSEAELVGAFPAPHRNREEVIEIALCLPALRGLAAHQSRNAVGTAGTAILGGPGPGWPGWPGSRDGVEDASVEEGLTPSRLF